MSRGARSLYLITSLGLQIEAHGVKLRPNETVPPNFTALSPYLALGASYFCLTSTSYRWRP